VFIFGLLRQQQKIRVWQNGEKQVSEVSTRQNVEQVENTHTRSSHLHKVNV